MNMSKYQLEGQRMRKKQLELLFPESSYPKIKFPKLNKNTQPLPKSKSQSKKKKSTTKKSKAKSSILPPLPQMPNSTMNWVLQNQNPGFLNSQVRPLKFNNSIPTVGLTRTKRCTPRNLIELHRDVHTTKLTFQNPQLEQAKPDRRNVPKSSTSSMTSSCFRKGQGDCYRLLRPEPEIPGRRYVTDQLKAQIIAAVREEVLMERRIQAQIEEEEERRAQKQLKEHEPETSKLMKGPKRSTEKSKSKATKTKKM